MKELIYCPSCRAAMNATFTVTDVGVDLTTGEVRADAAARVRHYCRTERVEPDSPDDRTPSARAMPDQPAKVTGL